MRDSQLNPYEHSDIKIKLLQLYLEKYISILANTTWVKKVELYDLFCGEGVYENGKKGSPIIILNILNDIYQRNKNLGRNTVQFNCHFNDKDDIKTKKLEYYIASSNLFNPEIGTYKISNENYQDLKTTIINDNNIHGEKKFIFIDPYGYKNISITDIHNFLSDGNTEVLLFLPTQFMYRFEKDATPEVLYDFLSQIMDESDLAKSKNGIEFINRLRDGFGKKLKNHYVDSFIITRDVNQYFALFFFTSHIYGFEKFLEAKWAIDEEEGRGWTPAFSEQDLFSTLPSEPKIDKFEEEIKIFLTRSRSNVEIHAFTIEHRHLIKHTVQILLSLQNVNKLEVTMNDGKLARKSSFYIGWNEVKTKITKCFIKIK